MTAIGAFPLGLPRYRIILRNYDSTTDTIKHMGETFTLPQAPSAQRQQYAAFRWIDTDGNIVGVPGDVITAVGDCDCRIVGEDPEKTITFDLGYTPSGGSRTSVMTVNYGTVITLPMPSAREHKTFTGWWSSTSGGTQVGNAGDEYTVTATRTLYAHWEDIPTWTVTLNKNNGSWTDVTSSSSTRTFTIDQGSPLSLPTVIRSQSAQYVYTFNGWWTSSTGGECVAGRNAKTYTPTEYITLYAQWTQTLRQYTVTLHSQNGNKTTTVNVDYGKYIRHDTNWSGFDYYPSAYSFDGWYTGKTDGTQKLTASGSYRVTENIHLYERWSGKLLKSNSMSRRNAGTNGGLANTTYSITDLAGKKIKILVRVGLLWTKVAGTESRTFSAGVNASASVTSQNTQTTTREKNMMYTFPVGTSYYNEELLTTGYITEAVFVSGTLRNLVVSEEAGNDDVYTVQALIVIESVL